MRSFFGVVVFALTLLGWSQTYNPGMSNPSQWYINNQMYSTRVFNGVVANSMLRRGAKPAKPVTAAAGKSSSFKWSRSILPKMLASKLDGGDKAAIERFFQSHLDLYRQTAAKDRFPANDLAYALEYFVVNNYHLYHELIGSPNGVTMSRRGRSSTSSSRCWRPMRISGK